MKSSLTETSTLETASQQEAPTKDQMLNCIGELFALLNWVNKKSGIEIEYPMELVKLQGGADAMGSARNILISSNRW